MKTENIKKELPSKKRVANKTLNKKIKNSTIMGDIFKSIVFSTFITLMVFMLFWGYFTYQRNEKYSISMLEKETKLVSTKINHYFQEIERAIDILSYSPQLNLLDKYAENNTLLLNFLSKIENNSQIINTMFVGYEDNTLLINDTIFPENYNFNKTQWYNKALNVDELGFSVANFLTVEQKNNPKLFISKSFSIDNKKQGVIAIDCHLDSLYSSFNSESMFTSKIVLLANASEQIVLSEEPEKIDQKILTDYPEIFEKEKTTFTMQFKNKKYLIYSKQLPGSDWWVISRISYSEVATPLLPRTFITTLLLLILTFIISKILASVLGKTIAKPVIEVSTALNDLANGHKDVNPIDDYPQNEIGIMAKSFNTFLDKTELLKADINELKDTKDKLSNSLSLLNASLESTDDGILVISRDKYITKWNKRFLELWGVSEEYMLSRDDSILLPRFKEFVLNPQEFMTITEEINADEEKISFDIFKFKDGRIIERYSFPQKIGEKMVGRVWRFREITKIRQAEIQLQDSEEKHRVLFTQTVDAYCILDNGVFSEINESAQIMLDSPKGWLIGKTPTDISPKFQPDGKLSVVSAKEHIREAILKGKHSFAWTHTRYDGTDFPAEITLITISLKEKDQLLAIWRDVTEERKIAEKLKSSEQNFRQFFETMEDMIFISDFNGKIKFTNKTVHEKLGYNTDDLTSDPWINLLNNIIGSSFQDNQTRLENRNSVISHLPLKTKDNRFIPVETKTWLGKWNGEDSLFTISKDISKEQEALIKFNKIFENNPALMALTSYPERKFIDVNNSFCKTLGYTKEEVIGRTSEELQLSMDLSKMDEAATKLVTEGNFTNLQMKLTTYQGEIIEGLFSGELIETNDKKFFLTVMTDITNMIRLDEKLRASERKYRLLFENMTSGFALHEMIYNDVGEAIDYRFLVVNPAFESYTGIKPEQLIGRTVKEIFPNTEDYWLETYGNVAKTRKSVNYEQYAIELGKYFEVKAFSPEPNKFATIFSDSTSRVKALKELEKEKEIAQAATKAKSEFLANMSHEIRTPLNGVIGFTDLLLSTELTPNQQQFAKNANISGKALLGIISDILDFSKIEAGKMDLDLVTSSITEILEQAIDIVKFSACKKGIDLILDIPVDFPEKALVDPLRLKQILLNLLNNAVKFTKEGEIQLSVRFIPHNDRSAKFIFTIKDSGVGISEKDSTRLFKAFSQADGSITRKYGGTGLGLVISNYFAAKMGSHIDFVSEKGVGSEFYFSIETDYVEKSISRKDALKGNKLLIADKNFTFLEVISKRFNYWGLDINIISDINTLNENMFSDDFDIIIIDERLITESFSRNLNEKIAEYKAKKKKVCVVITYCPNNNDSARDLSQVIKADIMLTKPLVINDLFSSLKDLCSNNNDVQNKVPKAKKSIEQLQINKQLKILIAEDVEMNMILIKTLVKKIIPRVEIHEAKNGMEAVHFFKKLAPDLVLMDIQMPELDGFEATIAIKKLEQKSETNTPIIALTAGAFTDDEEKCIKAGMVDYLTKPISITQLTKVLAKHLVPS